MTKELHYFIESTIPQEVSYFNSNFESLDTILNLNNFSKKDIIGLCIDVCNHAQKQNSEIHIIHSCLDGSPCGIILPQFSKGFYLPEIFNENSPTNEWLSNPELAQIVESNLNKTREYFTQGRKIHDEQEEIYIDNMNFSAANSLALDTVTKIFGSQIGDENGIQTHRFFGAATANGNMNYIPNLTADLTKRYFIKGRSGTGKSTLLKKLAAAATNQSFNTEIYHCSLDSNSLDMVIVRALNLCIFDSTQPHEYFPERDGDYIIDIYGSCVTPGTDEKYADELALLLTAYKRRLALASIHLKTACDVLNRINSKRDNKKSTLPTKEIISNLFNH